MLEYQKEIDFIFNQFPSYQKVGKIAYKPGIETMLEMDALLGHPHTHFKTIHIAGTNGKGSTSHMIASALARIGLKVGLYTSPHLADFRERIKINGDMISKEFVYEFILKYKPLFLEKNASFFEITTALAFAWFAQQKVDIAVIECGLGGRLDSTNIITPILSVITNIGLDHCDYLGHTYQEIAAEKAGIIKPGVPVVIGERGRIIAQVTLQEKTAFMRENFTIDNLLSEQDRSAGSPYVGSVFEAQAFQCKSTIRFAEDIRVDHPLLHQINHSNMDLQGACQDKNIKTVCMALEVFCKQERSLEWGGAKNNWMEICRILATGIEQAAYNTGLRGRWETLQNNPLVICDTGHNAHGFELLGEQIRETVRSRKQNQEGSRLFMIFGVVADKDLHSIQMFLPGCRRGTVDTSTYYLYVNALGSRALPAEELARRMSEMGFKGEAAGSVYDGIKRALELAKLEDFVFIGGSTFVVAEALDYFR